MRVTRHILPVLAAAALALAGCSAEEAATDAAATASADAAATASADASTGAAGPTSADAAGTADTEATGAASAAATTGTTTGATQAPSAEATESADASARAASPSAAPAQSGEAPDAAQPTGDAAAQPAEQQEANSVAGPASVVDHAIHLPTGGVDACLAVEGSMTCYFESQQFAQCGGDQPLGFATFTGGAVQTGCHEMGEVGAVPSAQVGQTFGDPDGNFLCDVVGAPGSGLRCTERASGTTALLTPAAAGVEAR